MPSSHQAMTPGAHLGSASEVDQSTLKNSQQVLQRRGRIQMILLLLFCMLPVLLSYLVYYYFRPQGGMTNYGELIQPQRAIPLDLYVYDEFQQGTTLTAMFAGPLAKKWLLISVDNANECDEACVKKLFFMRQLRIAQGMQRARIVPIWLITDKATVPPVIKQAYGDPYAAVRFLYAAPMQLQQWLPTTASNTTKDYLYLVDANGHLMMRFPAQADANKMRSDLAKLLKWNVMGQSEIQAWK